MASTIVAVATAPAPGGVGILRISGSLSLELARPLTRGLPDPVEPRRAYLVDFVDHDGALLDQGLFLYFQGPHSFTGEDVVELHAHGSPRLLQLLQSLVLADGRARVAEPGEFTRRAFLNGRIDLARAEAVADLVSAESEAAVRAAAAQLSGGLSAKVRALRIPLLAIRTDLEGVLNFPEEAEGADAGLAERLSPLLRDARGLLADAGRGRLIRRGARVVLFGPVNAGKSTLFNRLLGENRALVDDEPGTTRDVLEARFDLQGLPVTLIDTAGLREEPGRVEALGIARAKEALASADLALLVLPADSGARAIEQWRAEAGAVPLRIVHSKCDLSPSPVEPVDLAESARAEVPPVVAELPGGRVSARGVQAAFRSGTGGRSGRTRTGEQPMVSVPAPSPADDAGNGAAAISAGAAPHRVSGITGEGVEALRVELAELLWGGGAPGAVALVSERHADALRRATECIERAVEAARVSTLEVVSGELGLALEALGEITGESAGDALLDAIFQRFCIGK